MEKKDDEKKDEDPRLEYMFNYLTHSRKLKIDRWTKMLAHAEYKVISSLFTCLAGKTLIKYFTLLHILSISLVTCLLYKRSKILSNFSFRFSSLKFLLDI